MKVLLISVLAALAFAQGPRARVPVLLELFTSEGCSSCPPADALLRAFDREQPVAGAEIIVLSEHVDYWNQLGWNDPFSSSFYSLRQHDYAERLGGEVYTPELVVDGVKGFVGSDRGKAEQAILEAVRREKVPVRVAAERAGNRARVTLHVDGGVEGSVYLALAHDEMKSEVARGENAGRGLTHVAVVYSLEKVGKLTGGAFDKELTIGLRGDRARAVAFVVKSDMGRVLGVGQAQL